MGVSDTELGAKLRFVKPTKTIGIRKSAFSPWSRSPRATPSAGWARASGRNFCRSGCRKIGAIGRPMAAAATGSIPGRETGTIGSSAGCCKKSSPKPDPGRRLFHQTSNMVDEALPAPSAWAVKLISPTRPFCCSRPGGGGILYAVDGAAQAYPTTYYLAISGPASRYSSPAR